MNLTNFNDYLRVALRQMEAIQLLACAIGVWLLIITTVTYMVYKHDKRAAQLRQWRVPESTLLFLAFIGGTFGALAQMLWSHHKTSKRSFQLKFLAVTVTQAMAIVALAWYTHKNPSKLNFGKPGTASKSVTETPAVIIETLKSRPAPRRTPVRHIVQTPPGAVPLQYATPAPRRPRTPLPTPPRKPSPTPGKPTPPARDIMIIGNTGQPSNTGDTSPQSGETTTSPFVWK